VKKSLPAAGTDDNSTDGVSVGLAGLTSGEDVDPGGVSVEKGVEGVSVDVLAQAVKRLNTSKTADAFLITNLLLR
jgi:hypothetical protein